MVTGHLQQHSCISTLGVMYVRFGLNSYLPDLSEDCGVRMQLMQPTSKFDKIFALHPTLCF